MVEFVRRFLNMIVGGLLAHAGRLTKLAAAQQVVAEYTAALDDADVLENTGVPAKQQLAKLLRLEIEQTLETAFTAASALPTEPAALNGDGLINNNHPFALSGPGVAVELEASEAPAAATKEPAKRRGRRRKASSNGRKRATKVAVETIESTTLTGD